MNISALSFVQHCMNEKTCRYWNANGEPNVPQIKSLLGSQETSTEKLRILVDNCGMSRAELSRRLGGGKTQKSRVSNWFLLSKPRYPSIEALVSLSYIFRFDRSLERIFIGIFYPELISIQDKIDMQCKGTQQWQK